MTRRTGSSGKAAGGKSTGGQAMDKGTGGKGEDLGAADADSHAAGTRGAELGPVPNFSTGKISGPNVTGRTGRFQKGVSGNPKGRPRKIAASPRSPATDVLIARSLTLTRNGVPREVTAAEALQHRTYQDALAGDPLAVRQMLKWIARREAWFARHAAQKPQRPIARKISPDPTDADAALLILGIASPDPSWAPDPSYGEGAERRMRLLLEPWAVQMALGRQRRAAPFEERDLVHILRSTRDADRLDWPEGYR